MKITNEWLEVTLSTVNDYTTIQNTSGDVISVVLADDTPTEEEAKNARKVDYFRRNDNNDDEITYDHKVDTRKMYVKGIYLKDGESGYISVN